MATTSVPTISSVKFCLHPEGSNGQGSEFLGKAVRRPSSSGEGRISATKKLRKIAPARVGEKKQRTRGVVESLFQAQMGSATHYTLMSKYDYISSTLRQLSMDMIIHDSFYIAPAFMDKIALHITKNFMRLPNVRVPLILGIWGGKGQGKSFQSELVFDKMGIDPITISARELAREDAGEPAELICQRYCEAADIIEKGETCCLFIDDLDATVSTQSVNATLMSIANNPTNVRFPGLYKEKNARVPIVLTTNDYSKVYATLIEDGHMEKFNWTPKREDRIRACMGIFRANNIPKPDIVKLVDRFSGQSLRFFDALKARVYDDEVRKWIVQMGTASVESKPVTYQKGSPILEKPAMTIEKLLEYGNALVEEQENMNSLIG